jgi:hypothetical protein
MDMKLKISFKIEPRWISRHLTNPFVLIERISILSVLIPKGIFQLTNFYEKSKGIKVIKLLEEKCNMIQFYNL